MYKQLEQMLSEIAQRLPKKGQMQCHKLLTEGKNVANLEWIHEWVLKIYQGTYKRLAEVYALRPEETWLRYELLGITDLAEQHLLKKAIEEFRNEWKETYPYRARNVHTQAIARIVSGMSHQGIVAGVSDATRRDGPELLPAAGKGMPDDGRQPGRESEACNTAS